MYPTLILIYTSAGDGGIKSSEDSEATLRKLGALPCLSQTHCDRAAGAIP